MLHNVDNDDSRDSVLCMCVKGVDRATLSTAFFDDSVYVNPINR